MTAAFPDLKPLIIPDSSDIVIGAEATPSLLHYLEDINTRLKLIAEYQEPVIPDPPDTTGRLTAGTPLVLNPVTTSSTSTQAHGLGQVPDLVKFEMECLTAEFGYSVGDIVEHGTTFGTLTVGKNATNLILVTLSAVGIVSMNNHLNSTITAANWKITLTPYKLST